MFGIFKFVVIVNRGSDEVLEVVVVDGDGGDVAMLVVIVIVVDDENGGDVDHVVGNRCCHWGC